jgi:glycine dehydrogenase subunit 1
MVYLPHTDEDRREMLDTIGVGSLEALFGDIPEEARFPKLDLSPPCSEMEIRQELSDLARQNEDLSRQHCFLGAGTYNHFSPATVDYVLSRGEFYSAYTPYQPEISQGTLQSMFEYQSMICRLTAMEVSNASHYDGATSLAEGVLLALGRGKRQKVIISGAVHPQYRAVVETYLRGTDAAVIGGAPFESAASLTRFLDDETAALVVQQPNFFGQFEEAVTDLAEAVHGVGALLIVVVDPVSLGAFQAPGDYGADIVLADGQALGIPPSFGGPHVGIFATRKDHIRHLAGRLVGETTDAAGRRGYVLTLGTREQHIRRAKATSNICTNAALIALGTAVYLATLGKTGLRQVAELCYQKSHYAAREIAQLPGVTLNPQAPAGDFFKEFVVRLPKSSAKVNQTLLKDFGVIGGYDLTRDFPELDCHMLVAVTEMNTRAAIDHLVEGLKRAIG